VTAEMLTRCGIGKVKAFLIFCRIWNPFTCGVNKVQIRIFFLLINGILICGVFIQIVFSTPVKT